jgi:hypothetical protein
MAVWNRLGTCAAAVGAAAVLGIPAAASGGPHAAAPRSDALPVTGITVVHEAPAAAAPSAVHAVTSRATRGAAASAAGTHVAGTQSSSAAAAPMVANGRTGGTGSVACNDGTVTYTPTTLWPPNHKMQTITITYTDSDGDGDSTRITVGMITDNQAAADGSDELKGSGQPTDQQGLDWAGTGNTGTGQDGGSAATTTAQVRAERSGTDPAGRTYDIKVTCHDSGGTDPMEMAGAMQTVDLFVTVPHDQGNG